MEESFMQLYCVIENEKIIKQRRERLLRMELEN